MHRPIILAHSVMTVTLALIAAPIHAQSAAPAADGVAAADSASKYGWKHQLDGLLNLSQAYYDNWAKGGADALSYEWSFGASLNLDRPDYQWDNKFKANYGRTKLGNLGSRKSADQFGFESVYTRLLKIQVNPFASVTAQSQFFPGYSYSENPSSDRAKISDYFNPAYFTENAGVGVEPVKDFKERLGFTMKQTVGDYGFQKDGVRTGKDFKQEYGLSSITEYQVVLMENILFETRLEAFTNFQGVDEIDGRWANKITAKVNRLVSANFEYETLYDKDLSLDAQTRESLAIGISFLSL
jgi:hypothetical protein